jgi:hypothetical protein
LAPIHDTDLAEERYHQASWENFELWEKIEQRQRKRRRLLILFTFVLFLVLAAVPPLKDRLPKWKSLAAARKLGEIVSKLKKDASIEKMAYRIRVSDSDARHLAYSIEKANTCTDTQWTSVSAGTLLSEKDSPQFMTLTTAQGVQNDIPGLTQEFCYDAHQGSNSASDEESIQAVGFVPVQDLSENRKDRISLLAITGKSGVLSFE